MIRPPDALRRFSVSAARRVLEDVVTTALQGRTWGGEEEAFLSVSLTDEIKARVKGEAGCVRSHNGHVRDCCAILKA